MFGSNIITFRHSNPESDKSTKDWVSKVSSYIKKENETRTGKKLPTPGNFSIGPDYTSLEEVYGDNLAQLRKVKAKYDPKKVWRRGWVIEPDNA